MERFGQAFQCADAPGYFGGKELLKLYPLSHRAITSEAVAVVARSGRSKSREDCNRAFVAPCDTLNFAPTSFADVASSAVRNVPGRNQDQVSDLATTLPWTTKCTG